MLPDFVSEMTREFKAVLKNLLMTDLINNCILYNNMFVNYRNSNSVYDVHYDLNFIRLVFGSISWNIYIKRILPHFVSEVITIYNTYIVVFFFMQHMQH